MGSPKSVVRREKMLTGNILPAKAKGPGRRGKPKKIITK